MRITGVGLRIKSPKSASGVRTLELPGWAVVMLRRRREESSANEHGVVFPSPGGSLRDPSNTQSDLRVLFTAAGFDWVTSHVYRKTVALLMDAAGSPRARRRTRSGTARCR